MRFSVEFLAVEFLTENAPAHGLYSPLRELQWQTCSSPDRYGRAEDIGGRDRCRSLGLLGLAMAYYYRARRLARLFDDQAEELRSLLKKILRIEEELEFVLEFVREIPHLTGELNNQMNPRGLPEVLLNVVTRTFRPEQAVVMIRRRKTLAQPDGDNQFVAAAVAAPRASCAHGMVIGLGEGELGYVAQQQRVLDRPGLEREAASYRNLRAKGSGGLSPRPCCADAHQREDYGNHCAAATREAEAATASTCSA